MIGTVKRWGQLGYGFVRADAHEVDADMWSHERFVTEQGYSPRTGDRVEFEPFRLPDGRY